jgi:hypothetical protein
MRAQAIVVAAGIFRSADSGRTEYVLESGRCPDASDAHSIKVFGKNPGIRPHPLGRTLADAADMSVQIVSL